MYITFLLFCLIFAVKIKTNFVSKAHGALRAATAEATEPMPATCPVELQ